MRMFRIRFTTVTALTSCKNFQDGGIVNFNEAAVFLEKKVFLFQLQSLEIVDNVKFKLFFYNICYQIFIPDSYEYKKNSSSEKPDCSPRGNI